MISKQKKLQKTPNIPLEREKIQKVRVPKRANYSHVEKIFNTGGNHYSQKRSFHERGAPTTLKCSKREGKNPKKRRIRAKAVHDSCG